MAFSGRRKKLARGWIRFNFKLAQGRGSFSLNEKNESGRDIWDMASKRWSQDLCRPQNDPPGGTRVFGIPLCLFFSPGVSTLKPLSGKGWKDLLGGIFFKLNQVRPGSYLWINKWRAGMGGCIHLSERLHMPCAPDCLRPIRRCHFGLHRGPGSRSGDLEDHRWVRQLEAAGSG